MSELLDAALQYAAHGLNVFPLHHPVDGACSCGQPCPSPAKHPLTRRGLHDASSDPDTIRTWWERWPAANIGIRTGEAFDVIDLDGAHAANLFAEHTAKHGTPQHVGIAASGRDTGGAHLYCAPGGQRTIPQGRALPAGVEVKGVGGYVVAPPSLHISGRHYRWVINPFDGELRGDTPWPAWHALHTSSPRTPTPPAPSWDTPADGGQEAYGQAVLRNTCARLAAAPEGTRWNTLIHDTIPTVARAIAGGTLTRDSLTDVAAAAHTAGLDHTEVARIPALVEQMLRDGIREPIRATPLTLVTTHTRPTAASTAPNTTSPDPAPTTIAEAPSEPLNVHSDLAWVLDGDPPRVEPPSIGHRDTGDALLYAGRVNGIFGDPDSGKSWIAASCASEQLQARQPVAWLDIDHNGAAAIASRLISLGTPRELIADPALFRLYEPQDAISLLASRDDILAWAPHLAVLDSMGELIPMLGRESNSNDDVTSVIRIMLTPLALAGTAVLTLDHLTKDREARANGFAIGGMAKKRAMDGAYLRVEPIHPLAPGSVGKVRLIIEKDRHGHLKAASVDGRHAGVYVLDARTSPATWGIEVEQPSTADPTRTRLTGYMEKVSHHLASCVEPQTGQQIQSAVGGKASYVRSALADLIADGYVTVSKGDRNATLHTLVRRYFEATDGLIAPPTNDLVPVRPDLVPTSSRTRADSGLTSSPAAPPSLTGGGSRDGVASGQPEPQETHLDLVPPSSPPQQCAECSDPLDADDLAHTRTHHKDCR